MLRGSSRSDHMEVRDDLGLVVLPELHDLAAKVEVRHKGLVLEPLTSEGGLHSAVDDVQDGGVFVSAAISGHHRVLEQLQGDRALEIRGGGLRNGVLLLGEEASHQLLDFLGLGLQCELGDVTVVVRRCPHFMLSC